LLDAQDLDLMLFGDVLEHTVNPASVLRRRLFYVGDEGYVIVSLPNIVSWSVRLKLLGGHFDYTRSGIFDDTHLRFFTRDSATRLVEEAGLDSALAERQRCLRQYCCRLVFGVFGYADRGASDPAHLLCYA
jgi:hypothetical protein